MRTTASGTPAHTPNSPRFTRGPWRHIGQRFIATDSGAWLPVCEVLPGGVGSEEADANARLIAAAPELFAALAAIVAESVALTGEGDGFHMFRSRLIDQACVALRFAQEGRQ